MKVFFTHLLIFVLLACHTAHAGITPPKVQHTLEVAGIKLKLSHKLQGELQEEVNRIMRSESFFLKKVDLANIYLPIVSKVFKEEQVPDDLKYLCIQESGLVSDAVSSAKAVGFWQFKYGSGKEVGLRIDKYVDERLNIYASSIGAAKYFKRSNFRYKNWIYAVLAHMTGAAGAQQFVKKDYIGASKMSVDHRLHWYVKRFIAHKIAYENYITGKHSKGLRLNEYKDGGGKSIPKIAKELDVDQDQLFAYNKWLRRGAVPVDKPYTVLVPTYGKGIKKTDSNKTKDAKNAPVSSKTKSTPQALKEKDGSIRVLLKINGLRAILSRENDNLESLAKKSGIPVPYLLKFNDLADTDEAKPNNIYYLRSKRRKAKISYHTVTEYDSFWNIAQLYGIKLKRLKKLNAVTDPKREPEVGETIYLRKKRPSTNLLKYRPEGKIIKQQKIEPLTPLAKVKKRKTTPAVIDTNSEKFNVFQTGIERKKGSQKDEELQPQADDDLLPDTDIETKVHQVQKGETIYAIARRFGTEVEDIYILNDFQGGEVLSVGQQVLVPAKSKDRGLRTVSFDGKYAEDKDLRHTVKKGESLWSISQKYNVAISEIKDRNDLKSNNLSLDQTLFIPLKEDNQKTENKKTVKEKTKKGHVHEVKKGDTFYSIAKKYGITVSELKSLNDKDDFSISIGEKIIVRK